MWPFFLLIVCPGGILFTFIYNETSMQKYFLPELKFWGFGDLFTYLALKINHPKV